MRNCYPRFCRLKAPLSILTLFLALVGTTSCNMFDPIDSPTSDPQLLSAARAAFDHGDFATAAELYGKLSAAEADTVASEQAFRMLEDTGAGMAAFMTAFGTGATPGGEAITKLAAMLSNSSTGGAPGVTKRLAMLTAFQEHTKIQNNAALRGMVRFLGAMAILAELFSEIANTPGKFTRADLVTDMSTCNAVTCANPAGCAGAMTVGPAMAGLPTSGTTGMTAAAPTLYMVHAAILEAHAGLSEIGAAGRLGGATKTLMEVFIAVVQFLVDDDPGCYRLTLIENGFGSRS